MAENNDNTNAKRCKPNEGNGNENETNNKTEEDKTSPNPPEPLKDYIHVRARRGQATDSHSLAERVSIHNFCLILLNLFKNNNSLSFLLT